MRILFIGTVQFSYDVLEKLLQTGENVVGVITKDSSTFNADYKDLRPLCEKRGVPFKIVSDVNHPNNLEFIRSKQPDVIYCFGWSNLLKRELLLIPAKGVIGFHPAKLPENRGRHPIVWALALGLRTTASTFFFMDHLADTGDILSQEPVEIEWEDTANTLYKKITTTAVKQVLNFTQDLKSGDYTRTKQDPAAGNIWRKRAPMDGQIDFRMPSFAIYNLVRALSKPYVGAHVCYGGKEYTVWSAHVQEFSRQNIEPGKVLKVTEGKFVVKTIDSAILIKDHEFPLVPIEGTYLLPD